MNCQRELRAEAARFITRRWFFQQCGIGLGSMALGSLLAGARGANAATAAPKGAGPFAPKAPHYSPKARHVIYLFMGGAPSQLDLFDYKPTLKKFDGQPVPAEIVKGQKYAFIKPDA